MESPKLTKEGFKRFLSTKIEDDLRSSEADFNGYNHVDKEQAKEYLTSLFLYVLKNETHRAFEAGIKNGRGEANAKSVSEYINFFNE